MQKTERERERETERQRDRETEREGGRASVVHGAVLSLFQRSTPPLLVPSSSLSLY